MRNDIFRICISWCSSSSLMEYYGQQRYEISVLEKRLWSDKPYQLGWGSSRPHVAAIRSSAALSRACVLRASSRRSRCSSTTWAGARARNWLVLQLALHGRDVLAHLAELPVEPGALLVELDHAGERENDRGLVQHHLHRAGRHRALQRRGLAEPGEARDHLPDAGSGALPSPARLRASRARCGRRQARSSRRARRAPRRRAAPPSPSPARRRYRRPPRPKPARAPR